MPKRTKPVPRHDIQPQEPLAAWRGHTLRVLILCVAVFIAWSNSFHTQLVFDNAFIVGDDPRIRAATSQNVGAIFNTGYWHTSAASGLYRPITTLSFLFNYAILGNGTNPEGYHVVNLLLHLLNVALVYALGTFLFEGTAAAWALAALWGVHPVLTESVTNIVGRADLLAALGVLGGLLCYIKSDSRRIPWLAAMVTAQTIGIFSKESAAVLPGVMLCYDLAFRPRGNWRGRVPSYSVLLIPFALFFFLRSRLHASMRIGFADNPLTAAGFLTARLTAIKVIGKLLLLFVWPARMSPDYSFNAVPVAIDAAALLVLALCAAAIFVALRWRQSHRPVSFLIALFFIALLPTANLIVLIGSIMAERFLYLPSIGLCGCVVWLVWQWRRRAVSAVLIVIAGAALAARTYARNADWQDALSLWTAAVEAVPQSCKAHNNLGIALMPADLPAAVREFQAAVTIYPEFSEAHFNLASAFAKMPGHLSDAVSEYQAALRIFPDYADAHAGLAQALSGIPGRSNDALAEYHAALRLKPESVEIHNNLGILLAQSGREAEAVSEYQAALKSDPGNPKTHLNLGVALSQMQGHLTDAMAEDRAALRIDPGLAEAHFNLANALTQAPGEAAEAIHEYQEAIRLKPDYVEAHNNLAIRFAQSGRMADAIAEFSEVVRLRPEDAEAHHNLGNALVTIPGHADEAAAQFEKAQQIRRQR